MSLEIFLVTTTGRVTTQPRTAAQFHCLRAFGFETDARCGVGTGRQDKIQGQQTYHRNCVDCVRLVYQCLLPTHSLAHAPACPAKR